MILDGDKNSHALPARGEAPCARYNRPNHQVRAQNHAIGANDANELARTMIHPRYSAAPSSKA